MCFDAVFSLVLVVVVFLVAVFRSFEFAEKIGVDETVEESKRTETSVEITRCDGFIDCHISTF